MKTRPIPARDVQRSSRVLRKAGVAADRISDTLQELVGILVPSAAQAAGSAASRQSVPRRRPARGQRGLEQAATHFERGLALEASDLAEARKAYTAALAAHSGHLEATINLGRLMHLSGELDAAEKVYRDARQTSAELSFNLALLMEDLHRDEEAVRAYREALALDPQMHDAHLHLGMLHDRNARPREALRHLLAFRRSGRK